MRRFGCDVGNEVVRVLWIVSRSSNSSLFKSLEFSISIYIYIARGTYKYIYKLIESLDMMNYEFVLTKKKKEETSLD